MKDEIEALVRDLFRAENEQDRAMAEARLAADYIPITRARGQTDKDREKTLENIEKGDPKFRRDVDNARIVVHLFLEDQEDRVAIATTDLPTIDPDGVHAIYRNMQVFLRRKARWQCVAWQVTKVQ